MIPKDCKRQGQASCAVDWKAIIACGVLPIGSKNEPRHSTPVLLGITPRVGFAYQREAAAMIFSKRRKCEPAQ